MQVRIVYESMYGNTAAVARAIADGIRSGGADVSMAGVSEITPEAALECDLLVVGGPTHAHGMSRATTRKTAIEDAKRTYEEPTMGPGIREWLEGLHGGGHAATAFDTRIDAPVAFTGSASKGIAKGLAKRGCNLAVDRESFLVTKQNTLVEGELERARGWGVTIATSLVGV
jgi:multimeric flavodoxin WrbA